MIELGSAFPLGGSAYTYLLNSSSKSAALVAAALVVLDYIVNSVNAAGWCDSFSRAMFVLMRYSAAAYVAGETALPFSQAWLAVIILLAFALVGLLGVKESSSLAFAISTLHVRRDHSRCTRADRLGRLAP
jgi:amino acid transporter